MIDVFYNKEDDILLFLNASGDPMVSQKNYKNAVTVDFDIYGKPIMMEITEASIMLGMPKVLLKEMFRS